MTTTSTTVRATHLITNAAWFGGSLMGAVGLDRVVREGADVGLSRWAPVQAGAIGLHLLSGVAIVADNRHRVLSHRPTTVAVVLKTGLTGLAVVASAAAHRSGAALGEALEGAEPDDARRHRARRLASRLRWLTWATPVATGGLLVLDAYLGEQQRGVAGLLDRGARIRHRS